MQRCNVVKLHTNGFVNLIKQNITVILMLAVSVIGVLLGALSVKDNSGALAADMASAFSAFINVRDSYPFIKLLLSSLLYVLPFAVAVFLSGTSIVGIVTVPAVVCYYAFQYGQLAGYLYKTYALNGIVFTMLVIIPVRLIALLGLIIAAKESISFSVLMANLTLQLPNNMKAYSNIKSYCLHYLFFIVIFTVSALVDCLLSNCFIGFFGF